MQLRAYKYRAYPTGKQAAYFNRAFGCVRFVWNQFVANFNSWAPEKKPEPISVTSLKAKPEFAFLKETISYALHQKERDFEETKRQFFNPKRKIKLGRMKFKSRSKHRDSFRIPGQALKFNRCIDFEAGTIKLTKMAPMKIVVDRPFTGSLRSVTVSRNPSGQYFVSVLVEEDVELKQNTGRSVGIDLGLNSLLVLSNGDKIENPRWFRENQAKLKRAQQHLSRKTRGSRRREKQRLKVARLHQKTANQRKWYLHDISTWLVTHYHQIFTEDLNVAGMKKSNLGKSISDAGWSLLVGMIEYKSKWYGKLHHKVDRFFASSKTCSCCGFKLPELGRDVDEWICPSCGVIHDRDVNAAVNVHQRGLSELYNFTSAESADYIRGEDVRPKVPAMPASWLTSVKRRATAGSLELARA